MLRLLVLFVHLLAAVFWIGEMFFVALVVAPYARRLPSPEARAALFRETGRRTLPLAWLAVALLLATGVGNLVLMGLGPALGSPLFWRSPFGRLLALKLAAVAAMVALSAWHDFGLGRESRLLRERLASARGPERARLAGEYERVRDRAARVGRANLALGILVLFLAAGLVAWG
jgi:putative copper resistance protein D